MLLYDGLKSAIQGTAEVRQFDRIKRRLIHEKGEMLKSRRFTRKDIQPRFIARDLEQIFLQTFWLLQPHHCPKSRAVRSFAERPDSRVELSVTQPYELA